MSEYTPTFIFTWNPKVFSWKDYEKLCDIVQKDCLCPKCDWSCRSKTPKYGDRFILLMQGMGDKNGIVGCGRILGSIYELPFADFGGRFVDIKFSRMWNYKTDKYIRTSVLKTLFSEQNFTPQFSGIRVKSAILPDLWKMIERS